MKHPHHSPDASKFSWNHLEAPEHLVQIYEEEGAFLHTLEDFVHAGLQSGEAVVLIVTPKHRTALEEKLFDHHGIDVRSKAMKERYFSFDAHETMRRFLVNNWPDERLFRKAVSEILAPARFSGRKVRAFGEMVALLWKSGHREATIRLEQLWHSLCHEENFMLFCAYPKKGFFKDVERSIKEICQAHSRVVPG